MSDAPAPLHWSNLLNSLISGTTAIPKSVAKLIDTVGEQIGLFLEPVHIRRKGQAEADLTVAEARARAEIAVVRLGNKNAIRQAEDRADERVKRLESRRQKNVEAITVKAAQALTDQTGRGNSESVSDEPVDQDWVAAFFGHCQDISNDQMQRLWARILAGEVVKPGSFSLRSLAFVRTISKRDADLFTRFCSMLWLTGDGLIPITINHVRTAAVPGLEMTLTDFAYLDSLGLITFENIKGFDVTLPSGTNVLIMHYYGRPHLFSRPGQPPQEETARLPIGNVLLSHVGRELASVAGSTPNEAYRHLIVSAIRTYGWGVDEQ
jgi:hypothetical protein